MPKTRYLPAIIQPWPLMLWYGVGYVIRDVFAGSCLAAGEPTDYRRYFFHHPVYHYLFLYGTSLPI